MQRREFIEKTSLVAFGVGVFGNIRLENGRYAGDSATTTDILGPFYRPNAPLRVNINPPGYSGKPFHLSGTVFREDGKTVFPNCLVEIWQCDEHKVYDNTTDEFHYRGSQRAGKNGKYHFITTHPVPYSITPGKEDYRPAHIHMRISGEGQQDLITQIYFENDPHLKSDPFAASGEAVTRILPISKNNRGEEVVDFNVVMQKEFKASSEVYRKLSGIYTMDDQSLVEFYKDGDMLFVKRNGQIIEGLNYAGNNRFSGGTGNLTAVFELTEGNVVKVKIEHRRPVVNTGRVLEGVKTFKY